MAPGCLMTAPITLASVYVLRRGATTAAAFPPSPATAFTSGFFPSRGLVDGADGWSTYRASEQNFFLKEHRLRAARKGVI